MKRRAASLTGRLPAVLLLLLAFPLPAQAQASEAFALALPVKCQLGVSCFVQNYVDHDGSDRVRDYRCGGRSYDGHDGTGMVLKDPQSASDLKGFASRKWLAGLLDPAGVTLKVLRQMSPLAS